MRRFPLKIEEKTWFDLVKGVFYSVVFMDGQHENAVQKLH